MSRSLETAVSTALATGDFLACFAIEFTLGGTTYRVCSLDEDLSWDSVTWTGKSIVSMSDLTSTNTHTGSQATITLALGNSTVSTMASQVLDHSDKVTVHLVPLNITTRSPVHSTGSVILYRGAVTQAAKVLSSTQRLVVFSADSSIGQLARTPEGANVFSSYAQKTLLGNTSDVSFDNIEQKSTDKTGFVADTS